jgi:hypothetical protein
MLSRSAGQNNETSERGVARVFLPCQAAKDCDSVWTSASLSLSRAKCPRHVYQLTFWALLFGDGLSRRQYCESIAFSRQDRVNTLHLLLDSLGNQDEGVCMTCCTA